MRLFILC